MSEKVKFEELVSKVSFGAVKEALLLAKPSYKDKSEEEIRKILGLTEHQYQHFQKAMATNLSKELHTEIDQTILRGDSLEFPNSFNVHKYFMRRTNQKGERLYKLSITARKRMKERINQ